MCHCYLLANRKQKWAFFLWAKTDYSKSILYEFSKTYVLWWIGLKQPCTLPFCAFTHVCSLPPSYSFFMIWTLNPPQPQRHWSDIKSSFSEAFSNSPAHREHSCSPVSHGNISDFSLLYIFLNYKFLRGGDYFSSPFIAFSTCLAENRDSVNIE